MNSSSPSASRPSTIAGMVPQRAPMWRCQAASQSKDWNTVWSAWRSNAFHSFATSVRTA
jgi:hypothetical protein